MVSVLGNENLDNAVRSAAGQMLISLVENRPKLVAKKNMVTPVLTALVEMISKSNKESAGSLYCFARHDDKKDNEDDDDYDPDEVRKRGLPTQPPCPLGVFTRSAPSRCGVRRRKRTSTAWCRRWWTAWPSAYRRSISCNRRWRWRRRGWRPRTPT
jgi:hypothetical protein